MDIGNTISIGTSVVSDIYFIINIVKSSSYITKPLLHLEWTVSR